MTGQKGLISFALAFQGLQLAGHIHFSVGVIAYVQGDYANGVACNQELVLLLIVEGKGENAVQVFQEMDALLLIKGQDYLTVASCLEGKLAGHLTPDVLMVVYFAVYGQDVFAVGAEKGLFAALRVHNRKTLVGQDGCPAAVDAAPVGASVTDFLTHL